MPEPAAARPSGALMAFNELLMHPISLVERTRHDGIRLPLVLFAGAVLGYALYGAGAGFFQGSEQILVAALKAPLIILLSLLLCLPSLYVFSAMSGFPWTGRTFLAVVAGFAGTLGLVLLALLPVGWLFSVSSRQLAAAVFLQFLLWLVALRLSWRFLGQVLEASGTRKGAVVLWIVLFCVVSLQVTTMLRPVLERKPGAPLFAQGKKSFLEQIGDVFLDD